MIRVAPEGKPFIVGAFVILGLLLIFTHWWALLWLPVAVWVVAFFRDPPRDGERGPDLAIAPADGLVVDVREIDEPSFIGGKAQRVCIFMNVFDCHVNRYPLGGTVAYRHYNPGKFLNAADEKSSLENEQSSVGLDTAHGRILVRQIAGLIARRIITDHPAGTAVQQGERLGMIRFGSRVDLFLPTDARVLVQRGMRTKCGLTVVARWN
jgi:phosphatidylserine decarboxylase